MRATQHDWLRLAFRIAGEAQQKLAVLHTCRKTDPIDTADQSLVATAAIGIVVGEYREAVGDAIPVGDYTKVVQGRAMSDRGDDVISAVWKVHAEIEGPSGDVVARPSVQVDHAVNHAPKLHPVRVEHGIGLGDRLGFTWLPGESVAEGGRIRAIARHAQIAMLDVGTGAAKVEPVSFVSRQRPSADKNKERYAMRNLHLTPPGLAWSRRLGCPATAHLPKLAALCGPPRYSCDIADATPALPAPIIRM